MASFNDQGAERRPIEDAKAAHDVQTNPAATARPEGVPMAPLISTNQPRGVDGRRAWELGDISLTELERRNAIMKQPQGIVIDKERKASHQARYKELRAGATPTMDESLELLDDYIGRIIDAPLVVKNIAFDQVLLRSMTEAIAIIHWVRSDMYIGGNEWSKSCQALLSIVIKPWQNYDHHERTRSTRMRLV